MTIEQIHMAARTVALNARTEEWKHLDRMADHYVEMGEYAQAEDTLSEMAAVLDQNVWNGLQAYPAQYREDIGVAVNEFFGRLTGVIA